ncbi:hypothetical protein T07_10702 [Trichinella nelsoni]|uniref:Uncharacterized protein n=1 Tax=Trichinella nelsoni TaxID=6336 RepID=A0A0V0S427_9BILA|nr:hypothetical protein T07_10702 [Trichinella nelsoni]
MLSYYLSRSAETLLQDVYGLSVILRGEGDAFNGVPRRPLGVGQQVCELGGVVQVIPFVYIGLELGPKGREFQHLPCKLRESHLRQPPIAGPDHRHARANIAATEGAFSARPNYPCACSSLSLSVALAT